MRRRDRTQPLTPAAASYRRLTAAIEAASVNLGPLRDGSSRVEADGAEDVDGRPAARLEVTLPDGGRFTLSFDRESGLPVRSTRRSSPVVNEPEVVGSVGYHDYKDFGGLKVATRRVHADSTGGVQRSGYVVQVSDFKALDRVDPKTFAKLE